MPNGFKGTHYAIKKQTSSKGIVMYFRILLAILMFLNLLGCATYQKTQMSNKQIQQELQTRVNELENELKGKQDTISTLEAELEKMSAKMHVRAKATKKSEKNSHEKTHKNIQIALKNANLYNGPIDGRIGNNTKNAIKEFQKRNGLKSDGIVGKKTWVELKKFLPSMGKSR